MPRLVATLHTITFCCTTVHEPGSISVTLCGGVICGKSKPAVVHLCNFGSSGACILGQSITLSRPVTVRGKVGYIERRVTISSWR